MRGTDLVDGTGGKGANQAAAAARIGADGRAGGGRRRRVRQRARAPRVAEGTDDPAVVERPDAATGTAVIVVDADGENTIVVSPGANARSPRPWWPSTGPPSPPPPCRPPPADPRGDRTAAARPRRAGRELRVRPQPLPAPGICPPSSSRLADPLLVNEHERARQLSGAADLGPAWAERARALPGRGRRAVVVTLGGRRRGGAGRPPEPSRGHRDPRGAGDPGRHHRMPGTPTPVRWRPRWPPVGRFPRPPRWPAGSARPRRPGPVRRAPTRAGPRRPSWPGLPRSRTLTPGPGLAGLYGLPPWASD